MRTAQRYIARNPRSPAVSGTVLSYNSLNQLSGVTPPGGSSASPSPLSYDAAGNIVFDNVSGNTYLYDGEGRVCAVASSGPTGGALFTGYIYDADGTRVAKGTIQRWGTCDPVTNGFQPMTDYILGPGGEQLTEVAMDENGQMAWKHTWGPHGQVFVRGADTNVWAGDKLLATYDHDGLHYHLTDWLGTRRVQTDSGGAIEDACASLPYGDALSCIGPTFTTEHHFTGKERDTESGNDYFGARYYASSMGRWLSPDKPFADQHAQNPQSWNLYAYARNNPLIIFDPNGEAAVVLVNGNNVTIYFPVSFSGNANTPANQAAYTAAITSAWTGQFGNYNTTMHVVPGDPGSPLTNDVHINAPTPADGAFPRPTTDVGGPNMNLFGLGDNAAQNNYEKWASGHETGHGMGEQDQYHDATGPNPGYEHNIMGAVNGTPDARDINNVLAFHGNTIINATPSTSLSTETTTVNQTIPLIQPQQLQLQPRNIQQ